MQPTHPLVPPARSFQKSALHLLLYARLMQMLQESQSPTSCPSYTPRFPSLPKNLYRLVGSGLYLLRTQFCKKPKNPV